MPVVHAARAGARFRGDDGEDRVVLQIEGGFWPPDAEVYFLEARPLSPATSDDVFSEEEIYKSSAGLKLWACRVHADA